MTVETEQKDHVAVPRPIGAAKASTPAATRIAHFLRDPANLHYFAAIRPFLDEFQRRPGYDQYLVVSNEWHRGTLFPEYDGCQNLFTNDIDFENYDLVITPTFLREHERTPRTRAVQIFHGMSDKPFTYERDFSDYLLCLCIGQRQVDRLLSHPHNRNVRAEVVGYPKFDRFPQFEPLFRNGKRTVIYCPTWRKGGLSSIDRFLDDTGPINALARKYNLIVKPHPNLFNDQRPFFSPGIIARLEQQTGITVVRSGNVMPWFSQADLYVGDISASGYEWLYFDRPMVFLNPQPGSFCVGRDIDAPTYLWQCGPVCNDVSELPETIDACLREDVFHEQRERILHYSVKNPRAGTATRRGIEAIERLLEEPR